MPSPFPGMDPYLEGSLWPDLHQELAGEIRRRLVPQLRPKYSARLAPHVVVEREPEAEANGDESFYPDVDVVTMRPGWEAGPDSSPAGITPATATVPMASSLRWKLITVEVRDRDAGELVTAIEILSPVNKRRPGLLAYRRKRKRYWESGANLLEIDLLRRGTRPFHGLGMPAGHYYVNLTPADEASVKVWAMSVRDPLPVVPVPLLGRDGPATIDLTEVFKSAYDDAGYDLRAEYGENPPPPGFSAADRAWIAQRLAGERPG